MEKEVGCYGMSKTSNKDKRAFGNSKDRNAFIDSMPVIITNKAGNDLYNKLNIEKRLERFKALIKVCSSKGMSIYQTVEMLKNSLPGYIDNKSLTIDVFVDMLRKHSDIADCWGYGVYGDEINRQMVKDAAFNLAITALKMEEIKQYNEMYDTEYSGSNKDDKDTTGDINDKAGVTQINFFNSRSGSVENE